MRADKTPAGKWLLALVAAGAAARILLWWFSIGSNDVHIWGSHAVHVLANGLAGTYRRYQIFPQFNHPPLMGLYASQAWVWAGGDLWKFALWIKLPGLAGEALTLWALWRYAGPRAAAVYAWLPAAILVAGFHGSTDCLYAGLVLVAAIAFDKERYFLSGLLWSAALNVKLLPLALIPLVFLGAPDRKALARLSAGFALGMIPFAPPALTAAAAMYRNMLVYNSRPENWGLMALFNAGASSALFGWAAGPLREGWLAAGRYVVLLGVVGVALVSRLRNRMPMTEQAALGAALFFVFAPGFAVQYVVLAAPLLCMVDLREGACWGWTSGIFIGAAYWIFLISLKPLQSELFGLYPFPANALGMAAWVVVAHFAWVHLRSAWTGAAEPATPQPSACGARTP